MEKFFKEKINDTRLTPDMERTRSGSVQMFRKNYGDRQFISETNADVILKHERPEMYAELINGEWYWINGCSKCENSIEFGRDYSYSVCYEHNRCDTCGTHRSELTEIPWGTKNGFRCKPCQDKLNEKTKQEALEKRKSMDDYDFENSNTILCPICGSDNGYDIIGEDGHVAEYTCCVCDETFNVEINYSVSFTSTKKN